MTDVRETYGSLYEAHAQTHAAEPEAVGSGDYDVIGEIELDALRAEGLRTTDTLLDFGCGTGRLALHAVPYLASGSYIGIDIAPTFLELAAAKVAPGSCDVRWIQQEDTTFELDDDSVDMACAYSVFTHMEHEEMYRYLVALRRVVRHRLLLSCLPMSLDVAREIFLSEAELDPAARWAKPRNVTTSVEFVEEIATLAGWRALHWMPGDVDCIPDGHGRLRRIGQSIVVLERSVDVAVEDGFGL